MPWNETTKTEYTRPRARFESDLTDEEWILVEPCLPPPAKRCRPRETDLRQGRRRERDITVETQKVSRFSTAGGSSSGPSPGCRAAGVWRRTTSEAWRALWRGCSWPRALHDAPNRKGRNMLIINYIIRIWNFRSNS